MQGFTFSEVTVDFLTIFDAPLVHYLFSKTWPMRKLGRCNEIEAVCKQPALIEKAAQ